MPHAVFNYGPKAVYSEIMGHEFRAATGGSRKALKISAWF